MQADHFKGIIRDKTNRGGGTPTKGTRARGYLIALPKVDSAGGDAGVQIL